MASPPSPAAAGPDCTPPALVLGLANLWLNKPFLPEKLVAGEVFLFNTPKAHEHPGHENLEPVRTFPSLRVGERGAPGQRMKQGGGASLAGILL